MPMPQQYQRAGEAFDAFLRDARDELGHATRNQTYTTVEGVLLAFRRRLTVEQGLRFADALPAVLRAMFVAGWDTFEPPVPFGSREAMTAEVKALRRDHNFAPETAIRDVARALARHVDATDFEAVMARLPREARAFWNTEG